jgi:hypothetical protein
VNAGQGSGRKPDFARLGDLLGDACEAPAEAPADAPGRTALRPVTAGDPPARTRPASPTRPPRAHATLGAGDPARLLALVWPDIVGAEVAANASPVQLKGGRLTVSASSAAWAQTLQFMSGEICGRLRETLGAGVVEKVVFRHAGWAESAPRASCSPPSGVPDQGSDRSPAAPQDGFDRPLSQEQKEALAVVEMLDLPSDLRTRIARAMEAAFVRGEQDNVR